MVFFSQSDAVPLVFGHSLTSLLMQLFKLDHCGRCFSMLSFCQFFGFFFHVFSMYIFSWFLNFWVYHHQHFFVKTSGPLFLLCFWGSLTIVFNYFWWSPTISPAMRYLRCIDQAWNEIFFKFTFQEPACVAPTQGRLLFLTESPRFVIVGPLQL